MSQPYTYLVCRSKHPLFDPHYAIYPHKRQPPPEPFHSQIPCAVITDLPVMKSNHVNKLPLIHSPVPSYDTISNPSKSLTQVSSRDLCLIETFLSLGVKRFFFGGRSFQTLLPLKSYILNPLKDKKEVVLIWILHISLTTTISEHPLPHQFWESLLRVFWHFCIELHLGFLTCRMYRQRTSYVQFQSNLWFSWSTSFSAA